MGVTSTKLPNEVKKFGDSQATEKFVLTKKKKKIINQTWKKISMKKIDNGILVFYKLFELLPDAKRYFTLVDFSDDIKNLMKNPLVRSHALRFMKAIETMLEIEFDQKGCMFLFNAIGNRHSSYRVKPEYLKYVPEAFIYMLENALGTAYNEKVAAIWNEVLGFIIDIMQEKVEEGMRSGDSLEFVEAENSNHNFMKRDSASLQTLD